MAIPPEFESGLSESKSLVLPLHYGIKLAHVGGFEPPTKWLTATYSAIELHMNILEPTAGFEPAM